MMSDLSLADLTIEELKQIIRDAVAEKLGLTR